MSQPCRLVQTGAQIKLHTPAFVFSLNTACGLRAVSWENRLTGQMLSLGNGAEFGCDFDAAECRISIVGWRSREEPEGFAKGYARPGFDDAKWSTGLNPAIQAAGAAHPVWLRTHVFVPADCTGRKLTLVLGGIGLWDFRRMRVFLNGRHIGTRRVRERWHALGEFDVTSLVRVGQDNVLALEVRDQISRTRRLDALDPHQASKLAWTHMWPPQFEQYLVVGSRSASTTWRVTRVDTRHATVHLLDRQHGLTACVQYRWQLGDNTLHKFIATTNRSARPVRVLDVELGRYVTGVNVSEGEQGFPVYAAGSFFFSVAHPSGWAIGHKQSVTLRQHPGRVLAPGETFSAMETVLGVTEAGRAREGFVAHVKNRMRRVRRGHDKAYAIWEAYGSWRLPKDKFLSDAESEKILLDNVRQLAAARRRTGLQFDVLCSEFWVDWRGDLQRFDPQHFPRGIGPVLKELRKLDTRLGLWIDSTYGGWSIGDNPVTSPAYAHDPAYPIVSWRGKGCFCRATEPVRTMYQTGFRHHLQMNGVRLLKFDGLHAICYNPHHAHLPGIYSTEAIHNGVIECLQALDATSPEALMMLYWGYRSPWWLLHADTVFEPGLLMEAATPAPKPTLYARDGVTQALDMAQWYGHELPALGKDSLGVWLSDWPWNSQIGKERWEPAFVMDMCRGSLLAQPWNGERSLTVAEQKQMAEFIALLKAQPQCFANSRFILGNPWQNEPYGYECRDGGRAFIALHNCTWQDVVVDLRNQTVCSEPWSRRSGVPRAPAPARPTALRAALRALLQTSESGYDIYR